MPRQRLLGGLLAAAASPFGLRCGKGPSSSTRYHMLRDLGPRHNFMYVHDRVTDQWIYREFGLRVDTTRLLPEPISDDEHGDKLSLQLFKPGMPRSGGLRRNAGD